MSKNACTKTMCNMDRVFDAMAEYRQQYEDGLLARGEAVNNMIGKLEELANHDLKDAKSTVQSYGLDSSAFASFMLRDDEKEKARMNE